MIYWVLGGLGGYHATRFQVRVGVVADYGSFEI